MKRSLPTIELAPRSKPDQGKRDKAFGRRPNARHWNVSRKRIRAMALPLLFSKRGLRRHPAG